MSTLLPSKAVPAVALSVLLIASIGAVGPATAAPTDSDTLHQADTPDADETDANLTAAEILDTHEQRLESMESLSLTVRSNYSSDSYSSSATSSTWIDFTDEQMRTEHSSDYGDTITVRNESGSVTYNVEENTVRDSDITFSEVNPRDTGYLALAVNEQTELTYEETVALNGTEAYRLDIDYQSDYTDAEQDGTLWINTETYMPVQYEMSMESDRYSFESTVRFTNVSINETVPDDRFGIDIPDDAEQPDYSTPDFESYDSESALRQNASQSVPEPELPDGYTFDSGYITEGDTHSSVSLTYTTSEDESLTVSQSNRTMTSSYYSESDEFENVSIGDQTGYYNEFDAGESNTSILVWSDGDTQYTIYGSAAQSTVVDIAESME
jgi:outer membrane lipoprotein-sorting protein